jgi:hypothetical protein
MREAEALDDCYWLNGNTGRSLALQTIVLSSPWAKLNNSERPYSWAATGEH